MRTPPHRLCAVAFAFLAAAGAACTTGPGLDQPEPIVNPLSAERVSVSTFHGDRLTRRLDAAQILVVPRRVGPLEVAGVHELVLTRARIELFADDGAGEAAGGTGVFGLPMRPGVQLVSGSIFELEWSLSRGGVELARFSASRGNVDFRSGDVNLQQLRFVHSPTRREISAPAATLRGGSEVIIRGDFAVRDDAGEHTGRGLRMKILGQ